MSESVGGAGTADTKVRLRARYRPCRAPGATIIKSPAGPSITFGEGQDLHAVNDLEAEVWERSDGRNTVPEIASEHTGSTEADVQAAVRRLRGLGLFETIEESALSGLRDFHGPDLGGLKIADLCTGDYFTAVLLSDGSQGAAINFNNVSGPHRASFNHRDYDAMLMRRIETDGLLLDSILRKRSLDCLAQSVKIATLNALSRGVVTPTRLRENSLRLRDGYLDLASYLQEGDTVSMIGCTGNYSCPEIGKVGSLRKVNFSDFEYTGPFKPGIENCIKTFFVQPEKVELSDGTRNEAICGEADVVVLIADTICTNTLDELLFWSANAREILITGRSYVMDPVHAFARGAAAMTTQRIVREDFLGFLRAKIGRNEFGFTDAVVECFERMYVTEE